MSRRVFFLGMLLCISQSAPAYEEDLLFVEGLTAEGFPKLARTVLERTLQKFPAAEKAAPELRVRILIADKKFDAAAEKIGALDNAEPLWLFLAETAYAARSLPAAESAYKNYFQSVTDANDATGQAAFNYGELLEERGDDAVAKKVYEQALKLIDSRPVKAKLAALLVESDPDRALKLAEEVQLGGLDLWFGQAVVTWSQLMILKEEWDEATAVLETQLELLKQLEDSLEAQGQPVSIVSPLSGARYWLGVCYEHADNKAAALTQFYNVYAKYGDSEWGPKAQEKAQALKEFFEGQGKTVKIDLGANLAKMEESAFRTARRLFFDRQYAEAVPVYLTALNKYPEGPESITALRELTLSSIHLDDELAAKTTGLYLSERFAGQPAAGDALLAAGKGALDAKKKPLAWWLYDQTIEAFPAHPKMPAVLYSLAGLRKQERYLHRIIEQYPDSTYHARALGRLAWNAFEAKDFETAAARFAPYVETETDPKKQTRARFAFADSYRQLAQSRTGILPVHRESADHGQTGKMPVLLSVSNAWKNSLVVFQGLEKALEKAAGSYGVSKETLEFNRPFLEKSVYYQAVCQKELGEPDIAVQTCDRFLDAFPESEFISQVRFTKGKTLIESGRFAEALAALEPFGDATNHSFSESVFYFRGMAQLETGAYEAAIQTVEKLLMTWPASAFFFEAQFVQGRAYTAAGKTDDAIRVFGDILNFSSDDLLMHRASLELGRAQSDPAEQLASFQRVALLADPENKEHASLIAEALFESLPLYLELARYDDLLADSDRLLSDFTSFAKASEGEPNIGNREEIQLLKSKAEQLQRELAANNADGNGSKHGK